MTTLFKDLLFKLRNHKIIGKKILYLRLNIFKVILVVLALFSLIPIIILISQSIANLNTSKELSSKTIETTVKEQTEQVYKSYAQNLAKRISDFLNACEADLLDLSMFPATPNSYLLFSRNNLRWVNHFGKSVPLYKEVALINENGDEIIKISNGHIVPNYLLKNVSDKKNTTFLSETYFNDSKNNDNDIYVTHLTSWYVSRYEQLEQKKTLDGVIRFCKKLTDSNGRFKGVVMIALDFTHMLDFVDFQIIPIDSMVNKYKTGSYNYILDDEGWIIAHQKLWDIRGLHKDGTPVEQLTELTPSWKYETGIIPINLLYMDWRLRDIKNNEPMSSIIERVKRGETTITTMKSMGIYKKSDGITRTRAYAPIFYSAGPYSKHGIFGAVSVGTSLKKFMDNSLALASQLEEINSSSKQRMIYLAIAMSLCVVIFSFFIARWMAKPLSDLSSALKRIGQADYSVGKIHSPIDEIKILSRGVKNLAEALDEKDKKINRNVKELESVNAKLAEAKKELSAYWRHEYEIESDAILEEKIKTYEREYPILKEIRKDLLVGNSTQFLRILRQVVPQSQMNLPTWMSGESGVGKTALASVIHKLSPRSQMPFMIFEASEFSAADPMFVMGKLFGYGPGHGISGIDKNGQPGVVESCDGGTLLIDDVDALPIETQAQILRVVDGLSFHPAAGKSREIHSDVRFLFATNVNLEQSVKDGLFRKDLFRRIGGSFNKIEIPPLRDRKNDIPFLSEYFLQKLNDKYKISIQLTNDAKNLLCEHDYKEGNLGELRILIEIAFESARLEGNKLITDKYFPVLQRKNMKPKSKTPKEELPLSDEELEKLQVLRNNYFRMDISEDNLGFKKGSHTLSHYLKGMCLKIVCHSDFDFEKAATIIAGSANGKLKTIVKQRIEGYLSNVRQKYSNENKTSLLKNLPKEYHHYMVEVIKHMKKV